GRMRWNYTSPKGKLFLSDGTFFYLYLPETQRVHKARTRSSGDMHAPLAFLLGRLDFQKDFQRFISRPDGVETWIVAEPRSRNLPYTQVEFAVTREMRIRRVRVTGQDRSTLDFTFEAEKVNPPLDAKLFEFQLPAGATLEEALE
ncbi:MAG: LolA family protein, partial [Bryobacteraceae bacterium]